MRSRRLCALTVIGVLALASPAAAHTPAYHGHSLKAKLAYYKHLIKHDNAILEAAENSPEERRPQDPIARSWRLLGVHTDKAQVVMVQLAAVRQNHVMVAEAKKQKAKASLTITGGARGYALIVSIGRWAQRQHYTVTEHPAFGGVCYTCHTGESDHYSGKAIDVMWNGGGSEYEHLTAFYNRVKGLKGVSYVLWQVPDHYEHVHVSVY